MSVSTVPLYVGLDDGSGNWLFDDGSSMFWNWLQMGINICDYITVADFRSTYQGSATTSIAQDPLIFELIQSVARSVEQGGRWYYPQIVTRHYDRVGGRELDFPETDFLEVTTLTNGDGTVIASTNYDLLPYDFLPYYGMRTKLTSGIVFLVDTSGNSERALAVTGVAGFTKDYGSAWRLKNSITGALAAADTSIAGLTTGEIHAGDLLKLGLTNDYAYVSSVAVSSTDTAAVIRSVNGSTGITHGGSDPIFIWNAGDDFLLLCKQAVQVLLRLKDNPMGDKIVMPGIGTFSTPKDVDVWIQQQLVSKGYAQLY